MSFNLISLFVGVFIGFKDVLVELLDIYFIFLHKQIILSIFCTFNIILAEVHLFSRFIAEARLMR